MLGELLAPNTQQMTTYLLKTQHKHFWYAPSEEWYRLARESGLKHLQAFAKRVKAMSGSPLSTLSSD